MPNTEINVLNKLAAKVSNELDADLYLIAGTIARPADTNLAGIIKKYKCRKNVMVFLTTFGGDANVAYQMARCFQRKYSEGEFIVFVNTICTSAGTLLALGSNEIVMSEMAQLGPLDVQMRKPDELFDVISGVTPIGAMGFLQEKAFDLFEHGFLTLIRRSDRQIRTKTAADIAAQLAVGLFQPIYQQLNPLRLGEYHRNMMVALEYGSRLDQGNLKENALARLTHGYPSHEFVIDRKEAEEMLFNSVRSPSEDEQQIASGFQAFADEQLQIHEAAKIMHLPLEESNQEKHNGEDVTQDTSDPSTCGDSESTPNGPVSGTEAQGEYKGHQRSREAPQDDGVPEEASCVGSRADTAGSEHSSR